MLQWTWTLEAAAYLAACMRTGVHQAPKAGSGLALKPLKLRQSLCRDMICGKTIKRVPATLEHGQKKKLKKIKNCSSLEPQHGMNLNVLSEQVTGRRCLFLYPGMVGLSSMKGREGGSSAPSELFAEIFRAQQRPTGEQKITEDAGTGVASWVSSSSVHNFILCKPAQQTDVTLEGLQPFIPSQPSCDHFRLVITCTTPSF